MDTLIGYGDRELKLEHEAVLPSLYICLRSSIIFTIPLLSAQTLIAFESISSLDSKVYEVAKQSLG